jgi:sulfide:quinone oxidoreductase
MPAQQRVVIAGGGPAAIETALALRELAGDRVKLELVSPGPELVVRAYEVLAPFHEGREHRYPLARVAADLNIEIVRDALASVDPGTKEIALRQGPSRSYDHLIVAVGARHVDTLPGAIPFRGAQDAARLRSLLVETHTGRHHSVAFVVPGGRTWPLPLYELALHTSAWLAERQVHSVPLALVTPERAPLVAFGARVSEEVASVLDAHRIEFINAHAVRFQDERLLLAGSRQLDVDIAVALARLAGPRIDGLPCDEEGFLPVDEHGRVRGIPDVFAAGDVTSYPVKQGGLATQQADTIAETLAAELGAPVQSTGFQPTLRAVLYGGRDTRYLHAELGDTLEESSTVSESPLWPESSKLVGRYLAPYLDALDEVASAAAPGASSPSA